MQKIKCSVPILTLNSEKFLRRCLASVKDFEDVFLLDGNSTDSTLAIAKEYSVPVYKQVENGQQNVAIKDFSAVRIKSVGLCKCDWVLWIDSDEYMSGDLPAEVGLILEQEYNNTRVIYNIPKKYCIGEKNIEYSFNYPNYYPRLFNKKSGAKFKEGKIVHEQMYIPADVNKFSLKNCVYSEIPPNYRACVEKDKYQLGLMRQSTFSIGSFKSRSHSLKMCLIYFLRAVKIFLKSLAVYLRHGYKKSLPIGLAMRHVRVHLIMSSWRFRQFILARNVFKKL